MKLLRFAAMLALGPMMAGCPALSALQDLQAGSDQTQDGSVGDLASGFDVPSVNSGPVRVRFLNDGDVPAEIRLSMRVAGLMVHQANRRVPAKSSTVIVGPDRADSILVDITQLKSPEPRSLPSTALFLGLSFFAEQTVDIRIEGDPPVVVPPTDPKPEPPPPPPPPTPVSVVGTSDVVDVIRIDPIQVIDVQPNDGGALPIPSPIPPPGGISPFPGWPPGGNLPGSNGSNPTPPIPLPIPDGGQNGAVINVVFDFDSDPTNGNEVLLPASGGDAPGDPIQWDSNALAPGLYLVYTDQFIDGELVRVGPGPKAVHVGSLESNGVVESEPLGLP